MLEDKLSSMTLESALETLDSDEAMAHLDKIAELSIAQKENEDLKSENKILLEKLSLLQQ